jgi:myo-inositol-1(or 4)-monophosphatase
MERNQAGLSMKLAEQNKALACAIRAARAAGKVICDNAGVTKKISSSSQHDIKLELDVRCQKLIERSLLKDFPHIPLLGEEGDSGDTTAERRWVVDPIDGTVNFTYGVPHACVCVALQEKVATPRESGYPDGYATLVGVVYDPFCDEMWTANRGQAAKLNGKPIRVSKRRNLAEAIVSIGFAKTKENLDRTLPYFNELVHRVRKIRIMGSAALALTYVASGRFDAYIESGISLWDIAAGGLILECAGGEFWRQPNPGRHAYRMVATNGLLRKTLRVRY